MTTEKAKEGVQGIVWNAVPGELPALEVVLNHLFVASKKLILKTESGEELKGRCLIYTRDYAQYNFTAKKDDGFFADINDLQVNNVIAWAFDQKPNETHVPDGK